MGKPSNENGPLSGECCDNHGHSESRESEPSQERHEEPETANQHHVDVNHHCRRNIEVCFLVVRAFSLGMDGDQTYWDTFRGSPLVHGPRGFGWRHVLH